MWQGRQRRRFFDGARDDELSGAVRHLGKKYGITVEEERLTPEQEQARMKRESMFVINQRCAEHFRQNLLDPANKAAAEYVKGRWGLEYAEETGIGFAPDNG
jgi:DNA primase